MSFRDRRDAGRRLAGRLAWLAAERPLVLAVPRGGVPVAVPVAALLGAPLDVLAVRKLGAPRNPELAVGAVVEDGTAVLDRVLARRVGLTAGTLQDTVERETRELRRRVAVYRGERPAPTVRDRTVVLVDDGLATGLTDLAAVRSLRRRGAGRVIVAAPVGSADAVALLESEAADVVCHTIAMDLGSVGRWYDDFTAVDDDAVLTALAPPAPERPIAFAVDGVTLHGDLAVPDAAGGIVVFAHGSGSSRHSSRNRAVAARLQAAGYGTLLFDLLDADEEHRRERVFDIPRLSERLAHVARWTREEPALRALPLGLFGASTGAAAALRVAADLGDAGGAVVCRGGRPDLAGDRLARVTAPTLLVVGGADHAVAALNRQAAARLRCVCEVAVVDGATHLFSEPGALERVAALAAGWLASHLPARSPTRA